MFLSTFLQTLSALRSNLAIALYLLPQGRRKDALLFYTFCRNIDDCVDDSSLADEEKEKLLHLSLRALNGDSSSQKPPLFPPDFESMVLRRRLSQKLLCEIIHGMQMDLTLHRYATFEELRVYMWRVASAVGLVSAQLFGATGESTSGYAEALGIALQLTNILRDVAEDTARDRIYLPLEDLHRFNVTEKEIFEGIPSPQATHLFHHTAERALSYFAKADLAWEKMTPTQRRIMRPARLMEAIYRTLLEKMQRDRYDVFHQRYRVGVLKKIALSLQVLFSS